MAELYDDIGVGYRDRRRPDPRVAAAIVRALEGTDSVVNVGAGAPPRPSPRPDGNRPRLPYRRRGEAL